MENNLSAMKTRSIRADETVLDRFKVISEEFPNQSDALKSLITAWEVQNAKAVLLNMKTDISDFDNHLKAIQSAFLHILDINANTESRVKDAFSEQLDSKDKLIISLQADKELAEQSAEKSKAEIEQIKADTTAELTVKANEMSNLEQQKSALESKITSLEQEQSKSEQALVDKQIIINSLNEQLAEVRGQLAEVKDAKETISSLTAENSAMQYRINELEKKLTEQRVKAEEQFELAKERAEIDKNKAVNSTVKDYLEKIEKLSAENRELANQLAKAEYVRKSIEINEKLS